jgi:hypothetical protein
VPQISQRLSPKPISPQWTPRTQRQTLVVSKRAK